jgi:hypothetical protein
MLHLFIFISLLTGLSAEANSVEQNTPWCKKMEQRLIVSDTGSVTGYQTRWETKQYDLAGKIKSWDQIEAYFSATTNYKDDGGIDNIIFIRLDPSTAEEASFIEQHIYDAGGNLAKIEKRDLQKNLLETSDYSYDEYRRPLKTSWVKYTEGVVSEYRTTISTYDGMNQVDTTVAGSTVYGGHEEHQERHKVVYKEHRLFSIEYFYGSSSLNPNGDPSVTYFYEYNDDPDASYWKKETITFYFNSEVTTNFYDKKRHLLSRSVVNADGTKSFERYEYSQTLDDLSRPVQKEVKTFQIKNDQEVLDRTTTETLLYGPHGIASSKSRTYDSDGLLKEGEQTLYTYCIDLP